MSNRSTNSLPHAPAVRLVQLLIALALSILAGACQWLNPAPEFTDTERSVFRSLSLASLPPAKSISNRYAHNADAQLLGERLFFDPRLSGTGTFSCASCHQPNKGFTDGRDVAETIAKTRRNTPTLMGSAWQTWFYWDGRRDSLWSQALAPIETPEEMGNDRLSAVRFVLSEPNYQPLYEKVFASIPAQLQQLLQSAGSGASPYGEPDVQKAWHALGTPLQRLINQAFANIGKAIAAYEFTLLPESSRFDQFASRVANGASIKDDLPLNRTEIAGARLFIDDNKTQCLQCHNGPLFSNGDFHNTDSVAAAKPGSPLDTGRTLGAQAMLLDEFNCTGDYSDAIAADCTHIIYLNRRALGHLQGAFKTPTLRGLSATAPYFHDGRHDTLQAVMTHYTQERQAGTSELRNDPLTAKEVEQLIAFMQSLSNE